MRDTKAVHPDKFLEEMFESDADKKAMRDHLRARRLISKLSALRVARGITQTQVAEAMECKQARVSKIESGVDADLSVADIVNYAKAVRAEVTVLISDQGKSLAEQIKMHALSIRSAFRQLVELAHKDDLIAQGVAKLHFDAFQNINRFLAETAEKLPVNAENGQPYLRVVAEECDIESSQTSDNSAETAAAPKRRRREPTIQ